MYKRNAIGSLAAAAILALSSMNCMATEVVTPSGDAYELAGHFFQTYANDGVAVTTEADSSYVLPQNAQALTERADG